MNLIEEGADAVPAAEPKDKKEKHFRLLVIGKKGLPDPEAGGGGKGGGRKQVFWATVSTIGEDLKKLEDGLGEKTYETKTRGQSGDTSIRRQCGPTVGRICIDFLLVDPCRSSQAHDTKPPHAWPLAERTRS